jgi:ankyrin repeat protein
MSQLLLEAINRDDYEEVEKILHTGINPNNLDCALDDLVRNNNIEMLRLLLHYGASANYRWDSLIEISTSTEITQLLLETGANPFTENNIPLTLAVRNGNMNTAQLLIEYGCDPAVMHTEQLLIAMRKGDAVKELIQDCSTYSRHEIDEIMFTSAKFGYADIATFLISRGFCFDVEEFLLAAECGNTDLVMMLAPEYNHAVLNRALMVSARGGSINTVRALLSYGADVHAVQNYALRWAVRCNNDALTAVLLDAGADISAVQHYCIKAAAGAEYEAIIDLLVAASAGHPSVRYYNDNGVIYISHRDEGCLTNVPGTQVFCTDLTRMNPDFLDVVLAAHTAKSAAS